MPHGSGSRSRVAGPFHKQRSAYKSPSRRGREIWRAGINWIGSAQRDALYQHDYSLSVSVSRKVWPGGIYAVGYGNEIVTLSG
jgi:hypothetical protein